MSAHWFIIFALFVSSAIWAWVSVLAANRTRLSGVPLALHPLFLLTIFIVLIAVDFLVLFSDVATGSLVIFSRRTITEISDVSNAMGTYALLLMIAAAGLYAGALVVRRRPAALRKPEIAVRRAAFLTFFIILVGTIVIFLPVLTKAAITGSILDVAATRTVLGSENMALVLAMLMLAPSTLLYAAVAPNQKAALMAIGAAICVYFLFGSRFNILLLLYGAVLILPIRRHITVLSTIITVPVILLGLSFYAYLTRFTYLYDSYVEFIAASGGFFSSIFRSAEFSIAESMTVHLSERLADREWYDSLLAGAVALVPREFIPWKPLGISTELTMAADPARWLLVRSEWTVGGFTNLVYEMGLWGASLVVFGIFAISGRVSAAANRSKHWATLYFPLIFIAMVAFMRADTYNFSIRIWSILLVIVIFWMLLIIIRHRHEALRDLPHSSPHSRTKDLAVNTFSLTLKIGH